MSPSIDISNANKGGDPSGVHGGQQLLSGSVMTTAGVPVTNLYGLRRWRAALADALNAEAHIVCSVDSHAFGQNANGNNTSLNTDRAADNQLGWVGQLRKRFALTYGDPGEGFIFVANSSDSRITEGGSPVAFAAPTQSPSVSITNRRLTSGSMTLTFTVPTGCTRVIVGQANFAGNVSSTWTLNAVSQGSISTLTGTGVPIYTTLTVVAGQAVVITGPASGNDTFLNFTFRTAQTSGVVVHNIGVGGRAAWVLQGGVFSGLVATNNGTTFYSAAEQTANIQACYKHAGASAKGLFILYSGTNEQALQTTTGLFGGVTPAIMAQGVQQVVQQVAADGWCTLLVGPPQSGSELGGAGTQPLTSYSAALKAVAAANDHCAFIDVSDLWGLDKLAASNAGLRDAGSSHPTRAGYGDLARAVYRVLDMVVPVGN